MDDPLYRDELLDHYDASPYRGRLDSPDLGIEMDNPLCGDHIRLELKFGQAGRIDAVRFDGHGCVMSQAGASMLAERVEGLAVDDARRFTRAEMLALFGAPLTPARQKCGLLAWRALQKALPQADAD
jgi:nitrogen fixation NifU-like protein